MENLVVRRLREEPLGFDAKKFLIMRTLARFHGCGEETLLRSIDSTEGEIQDVVKDMISKNEVEALPAQGPRQKGEATLTLTLDGWREYMKALGSVYELPE